METFISLRRRIRLPAMIEQSLTESFREVVVAARGADETPFDLVVRAELTKFAVKVPGTIFSPTLVTAELTYHVRKPKTGETFDLIVTGTQDVVTARDRQLHEQLSANVGSRCNSVSKGGSIISMAVPKYEELAGRDVTLALLHCVEQLNVKLRAVLEQAPAAPP